MKRKYIYSMSFIGILILSLFAIGTGYGVYVATKDKEIINSATLDCFEIYYSDSEVIYKNNITAVTNEEGQTSAPITITVTNICKDSKELQLRLNLLNDTTVNQNALTISASGNIEQEKILYKNLTNTKTTMENVMTSKLIGLINIEPGETVRTNIKYWFDEKKGITINPDQILSAKFELIDTESSIKNSLSENLKGQAKEESIDFSNTSNKQEGLIKTNDNDGETYAYRGIVTNNYVSFAGLKWRIVRVNGDGSVRIILDKSTSYSNYSDSYNSQDYTGLQYVYNNNMIDNNINVYLSNWYDQNITNKGLDSYVATSSFCNDSSYETISYHSYFNGYNRIVNDKNVTLVCEDTSSDFGGLYKQKIGLITADEVAFAGGAYNIPNYDYYLYNGENFYTETPAEYYNYHAYMLSVTDNGSISTTPTDGNIGIRPVINLSSTVTASGSGTEDDPYTIDIE